MIETKLRDSLLFIAKLFRKDDIVITRSILYLPRAVFQEGFDVFR